MKIFSMLAVAMTLAFHLNARAVPPNYSILQGSTSETVAHFTITARSADSLVFKTRAEQGMIEPARVERREFPGSDWVVYRVRFSGLSKAGDYRLQVFKGGDLVDERNFRTMGRASGRVAIASCMLRQFHNPFLWSQLAKLENRPDALLIVGDAVYLDRASLLSKQNPLKPIEVWEAFALSRNQLGLYRWRNLVPTLTIWDDHDSGGDNVDSRFALMSEIRPIYEAFMANDAIEGVIEHGPGVSKAFQLFGKNFIMLDGRSFREATPESPMLGPLQESWMLNRLQPGANFLVNGIQFYGGYLGKDSLEANWPTYALEFTRRLAEEGRRQNARIAFISGDVHFSQIQLLEPELLGYETVEITSSSAHSMVWPSFLRPTNPRPADSTGTHNVVLIEFPEAGDAFQFEVRALGWLGNTKFDYEVSIATEDCAKRVVN